MNFFMKKAHRSRAFIAACLALTMSACNSDTTEHDEADVMTAKISGSVAYRERIALTPGHTLKVTLSDVSIADRAAPVLAESSRVLEKEQVPLSFEIEVESAQLLPRHQYSVRAVLTDPDGKLVWTTDTVYPIDIQLQAQTLGTLKLVKVGVAPKPGHDSAQAMQAATALSGSSWQVEDVASGGVIDRSNLTLNFDGNGRVQGSSGCNQYTGEFSTNGNKLAIGKLAGTMMACPPALMDLEQKFLSVLTEAAEFSVDPDRKKLTITATNGQTLIASQIN